MVTHFLALEELLDDAAQDRMGGGSGKVQLLLERGGKPVSAPGAQAAWSVAAQGLVPCACKCKQPLSGHMHARATTRLTIPTA